MSRTQVARTWLVVGALFLGLFLLFGVMTSAPPMGHSSEVTAKLRDHAAGVLDRERQDQPASERDLRGLWRHGDMHWLKCGTA